MAKVFSIKKDNWYVCVISAHNHNGGVAFTKDKIYQSPKDEYLVRDDNGQPEIIGAFIKSESSSISDVVPPTTKDMEHINADEDKHNQIICLYNEDYSITQLSELYGISCQDIRKIIYLNVNQVLSNLIKKGTDSATNHPDIKDFEEISKTIGKTFGKIVLPVSYQEKQKMIKLYNDGYSISEISKILMRSKTTVSSVLRKNDNEIRITAPPNNCRHSVAHKR